MLLPIVDGGFGVNVLYEETWKATRKPTLWPPTFQLVGVDQHEIKPIETLMGQKVVIDTQNNFVDFVVITLEKKRYDALLGGGWLVTVKATHNWKYNTLSIESKVKKYTIDLRNQSVSQDMASDLEPEGEGQEGVEPDQEGVLILGEFLEVEVSSLNGLFHLHMRDYEVF